MTNDTPCLQTDVVSKYVVADSMITKLDGTISCHNKLQRKP